MMKNYIIAGIFVLSLVGLLAINIWLDRPSSSQKVDQHMIARAQKTQLKKKNKVSGEPIKKFDGPEKYAQYHKDIRTWVNQDAPSYKRGNNLKELRKAKALLEKKKKNGLERGSNDMVTAWAERGPSNVPGRTRGLIVDPDDPNKETWFAGSVGGGVWKTEDAGATWRWLTPNIPNLTSTVLGMAASNHDVIYLGTGESFGNLGGMRGDGIFKSVDRGETWTQIPSTIEFTDVNRLQIDPSDENIVVVATNETIYRTIDGGDSWTSVHTSNSNIEDLDADPNNFNNLYATINSVGVIKSEDAGLTWSDASNGLNDFARLEMAIAKNNSSIMYLSAQPGSGSKLFMSRNAGESWAEVTDEDGTNPDWLRGQGWYDNTIEVNPFNDNIVFVGGVDIWKLEINLDNSNEPTGTAKTNHVTDVYGGIDGKNNNVHPDQHNLVMIEGENNEFRILNANDGGIFYSKFSTDPGVTSGDWSNAVIGYNSTQFYGADKKPGADEYAAGAQDNGTWHSKSGEVAAASSEYVYAIGGDGFEVAWNYHDPQKIIGASQNNGIRRTINGGESWIGATSGITDNGPFVSRIASSKIDPDLLFVVGSTGVWKSSDFGGSWASRPVSSKWGFTSTTDVEISLASPSVVWAGAGMTASKNIHVSKDGGETFEVTNNFASVGNSSGIYSHPTDEATAFVLFSQQGAPKIVKTTDYGQNWEDITGFAGNTESDRGFPDVAVYSILVMPHNTDVIWAGTDIGIFESEDGGASWVYLDTENEFPAVSVWDMKVVDDQVVIATHGRGVWTATIPDLPPPPAAILNAQLAEIWQPINEGNHIALAVFLRSAYDYSEVYIDGEKVQDIPQNTEAKTVTLDFEVSQQGEHELQVISTVGDKTFISQKTNFTTFKMLPILKSYKNDFTTSSNHFAGNGFSIKDETGFDNRAIHSNHPYSNAQDFIYTLKHPVTINDTDASFSYKDVAIIEKGNDGVEFGQFGFWDYVIVEASTDNRNWVALADGYDANFNSAWSSAHDSNGGGTSDMFVSHQFTLTDKFNVGDVVMIRFRLSADEAANSWGWAIDDIEIQPTINNDPIAKDDVYTTRLFGNVLLNDVDYDVNDELYVSETLITQPANGTVTMSANGDFVYKANRDFPEGTDSFTYGMTDDPANPSKSTATVTVTVTHLLGFEEDVEAKKLALETYPNPAISYTNVKYYLPNASEVSIQVFDLNGKMMKEFISGSKMNSGINEYKLNLNEFKKGLYIVQLSSDYGVVNTKIVVQ